MMSKPSSGNVNCFHSINLQVSGNKKNGETASRRRSAPSVLRSAGILAVFLAFSFLSVGDLWAGDRELTRLEFQVGESDGRETKLYFASNVPPDGAFSSNDDRFFEFEDVRYEIKIVQSGGGEEDSFQILIDPKFPPKWALLEEYDVHTGTTQNGDIYTEHQTFNFDDPAVRFVQTVSTWDGTGAGWTTNNENAVVRITGPTTPTVVSIQENEDGELRLRKLDAEGTVLTGCSDSGRTEIFNDPDNDGTGEWRGICNDGLGSSSTSTEEAAVICRQLGCLGGKITPGGGFYDSDVLANFPEMLIDNLVCTGSENRVLDCEHAGRGNHNCYRKEIFKVSCDSPGENSTASGLLKTTGTLEVGQTLTADVSDIDDKNGLPAQSSFNYQWVRVNTRLDTNDNEEDISNATSPTYVLQNADFGKSIKLELSFTDDDGNKEAVRSRVMGPVTVSDANAADYDGWIRLAAGDNELKGVVEMFDGKTDDGDDTGWESVCANTGWGSEEAGVVCRQLGASGNTSSAENITLSRISPPRTFLLDSVDCGGDEDELLDCEHGTRGEHDCSSWNPDYAKVTCSSGGS